MIAFESVSLRALTGFSFVDAITAATVLDTLTVTVDGSPVRPNRSGIYPVFAASTSTVEIRVADPALRYLPRRATLAIPASPLATPPPQLMLFASPAHTISPNWAVVRASVVDAATSAGLPWSSLRIARTSDGTVLANGIADPRGEALLAVQGLSRQWSSSSNGPVTEATVAATLTAWFDPALRAEPANWVPDPSILRPSTDPAVRSATASLSLAPGTVELLRVPITI